MGLFDRFKKQNKEVQVEDNKVEPEKTITEAEDEAAAPKAEQEKEAAAPKEQEKEAVEAKAEALEEAGPQETVQNVVDENRRFTLVVEDGYSLQDNQGAIVAGILYGEVQKEDAVYVIYPNGTIALTKVDGIEVGPGQEALRAENQKVTIRLNDLKEGKQVPKYTVLTSIRPQTTVDVNTSIENPQLLALSMDYPRWSKDMTYFNLLIYVICHAHFVVPISLNREPVNNGNTAVTFQKETQIRFPSLQDPTDKSRPIFPIFTDWRALSSWKNLFDEKHPAKSMVMSFPDVVGVSKKSGVVINPFGPTAVTLPKEMIERIVNMEGYKQEFVEKRQEGVKKIEMSKEAKIVVGVPKETNEIKLIKDALITYAKSNREIKRVDFLLKMDEKKEKAYLCIVDCPEEQAEKLFQSMYKAAAPYFGEIKLMEFLISGKTQLAKDVANEKSCIYEEL